MMESGKDIHSHEEKNAYHKGGNTFFWYCSGDRDE